MQHRIVLRNGRGRFLEVVRLPNGALEIHGHDIGGGAEIFGSDDYEWFKTIQIENLERCREVFEVPEDVELLDHLREHFTNDQGARFERLVRDNELSVRFSSWP